MKKSIAMKWVKALRSGKYKQGVGMLRSHKNEFCCLGVLCDLAPDRLVRVYKRHDCYAYNGDSGLLSKAVMKWAGIKTPGGQRMGPAPSLCQLNDSLGVSLGAIANIIEDEWESL